MITEELARLLDSIRYENLTEETVLAAKQRLTDFLAIAVAGNQLGTYREALSLFHEPGSCTVIATKEKVSLHNAVIVNGFMAHSTWYEDGSRITGGHPSSSIFPALLALAEQQNYNGRRLIEATVAGYEVFNRIGATLYPATVRRGFLPTGLLAPIAAAAACAKLMGLDAEGIAQAMNIAAPLGSGLKSAFRCGDVQPIQIGRGGEAGLTAARFAARGLKGYEGNLEAFLKAHETNEGAEVFTGPADRMEIVNTYMKVHAGCRGNHAPLDTVLDTLKSNAIRPENIEELIIDVDTVTAANENHDPQDHLQAQFNIPFSVAVALLHGNASLMQYTDENLADPAIRQMMGRIKVHVDADLDKLLPEKRGARCHFRLKDGNCYEGFTDLPEGEPERPLSQAKLEEKFILLTKDVLHEKSDALLRCLGRLEKLTSVMDLMSLLEV